MIPLTAAALFAIGAVVVQFAVPGRALYHAGWYNVTIVALAVVAVAIGRKRFQTTRNPRFRLALIALLCGTASTALAGAASGLFGPDNQTIIGAPGQRVPIEGLGVLIFGLGAKELAGGTAVTLERPSRQPLSVGEAPRYAGNFILRSVPRSVAYVEAWDHRGSRLTITQPTGPTFLSPVLLMEHRQNLAGLDLPYDSFNVPALRRVVKAVAFDPAESALLLRGRVRPGDAAVLFAVDDENGRLLPHAIGLSYGGGRVAVGDLLLRARIATFPAVEVFSSPNLSVTVIGVLIVIGAIGVLCSSLGPGDDRPNVS